LGLEPGIIEANGGDSCFGGGGGGGGGRVAVEGDISGFTGKINTDGGKGHQDGEDGTIVINGEYR